MHWPPLQRLNCDAGQSSIKLNANERSNLQLATSGVKRRQDKNRTRDQSEDQIRTLCGNRKQIKKFKLVCSCFALCFNRQKCSARFFGMNLAGRRRRPSPKTLAAVIADACNVLDFWLTQLLLFIVTHDLFDTTSQRDRRTRIYDNLSDNLE